MGNRAITASPLIFAGTLDVLCRFARHKGLDPLALLAPLGVEHESLAQPDNRVAYEALIVIWRELLRRFPEEPLGLEYARSIAIEKMGLIGLVMMHSADVGTALQRMMTYQHLLDPEIRYRMRDHGEQTIISVDHEPRVLAMEEPFEMFLGTMCIHASSQIGPDLRPTEVRLRHARRHALELYDEVFRCPVQFEAPEYAIEFDTALLAMPFLRATPEVATYISERLQAYMPARLLDEERSPTWRQRVEEAIGRGLDSGHHDQQAIARALHISVRSMQRYLRGERATYSECLDAVRRERALELIARDDCPIYDIALALGYSEPSTFYRAFKRWTRRTPASYRDELAGS